MKKYLVRIEGVSPLLMNRPNQLMIADKAKDVKRETQDSLSIAEDKLYRDSMKRIYVPATWLEGCLINAGKYKKMSGKGSSKATYSKITGSVVEINPFEIILMEKWDIFSVLAVNPNTRGRNLLHRPKFNKWSLEFDVSFDEEHIEVPVMKELFDIGGRLVGIGDWRPEKKGRFGKFMVTKFKELIG